MTKLDEICDLIAELEFSDHQARELRHRMSKYAQERERTYRDLRQVPAFRKLWDALREACDFTCRCSQEDEERQLVAEYGR